MSNRNNFIGEWLKKKLRNKKLKFQFYDHKWLNKKKQLEDFENVKKIYIIVLKIFSDNLNQYHKKKFSVRQWEVMLFSFLSQYISIVYDRWNMIERILKKFELKKIELINYDNTEFFCNNSQDLFNLLVSHHGMIGWWRNNENNLKFYTS